MSAGDSGGRSPLRRNRLIRSIMADEDVDTTSPNLVDGFMLLIGLNRLSYILASLAMLWSQCIVTPLNSLSGWVYVFGSCIALKVFDTMSYPSSPLRPLFL